MQLPRFEYIQPQSLQEACGVLREQNGKAVALAGGTALMVDLRRKLCRPDAVVGMKALAGLSYLRQGADGGLAIGAMATLEAIESSPIVADGYAPLAEAARLVGVPPLRHLATAGGNLCQDTRCIYYNQSEFWRMARPACFKLGGQVCHAVKQGKRCLAVFQSDLAPVLLAMQSKVQIVGAAGQRVIPLAEFYTGRGEKPNVLEPGEILAEVQVPATSRNAAGAYEKLRMREGMDYPLAGVAVSIEIGSNGVVTQARLVLGAVAAAPVEVPEATEVLLGQRPSEALLEAAAQKTYEAARPIGNLAVDASYRRKMVRTLTRRALQRALASAGAIN